MSGDRPVGADMPPPPGPEDDPEVNNDLPDPDEPGLSEEERAERRAEREARKMERSDERIAAKEERQADKDKERAEKDAISRGEVPPPQ